jgi:hypothetical protein
MKKGSEFKKFQPKLFLTYTNYRIVSKAISFDLKYLQIYES